MKKYKISISEAAFDDIQDLFYAIIVEYKSPLTAKNYVAGLYAEIKKLETTAGMFAIRNERFFLRYGHYVRTINYKKMTVVYTVHEDLVYVHRVVAASLIIG